MGTITIKTEIDDMAAQKHLQQLEKEIAEFRNEIRRNAGRRGELTKQMEAGRREIGRINAELARQSASAQDHTVRLSTALDELRAAFLSAFAPVADVVVPILAKFISRLAGAMDAAAQFIALMTGKDTYKKAVVGAAAAADAVRGIGRAAKEAQRQLSGLDEMNRWESASGGGGGGSGSAPAGGITYEETPVTIPPESFAGRLAITMRDVLFDWSGLTGEQIAEKVIAGLAALAGGAAGFAIGGVPGALVGTLTGLTFGLVTDAMIFDHDGTLSKGEIQKMLIAALGALAGGVIGFAAGGVPGALIGAVIGAGLTLKCSSLGLQGRISDFKAWAQENILDKIQSGIDRGKALAATVKASIGTKASELWSTLKERWEAVKNRVVAFGVQISTAASSLCSAFKEKWKGITGRALSFTASIGTKASALWNGLKTAWKDVTGKTVTVAAGIGTKASTLWSGLKAAWKDVSGKTVTVAAGIGTKATTLWNGLKAAWKGIADRKVTFAAGISTKASTLWSGLKTSWDGMSDKTLSFGLTIGTTVSSLWESFREKWKNRSLSLHVTYTEAANGIQKAIAKAFGLQGWPTLSFAARGGIVDAATLFGGGVMAGESGKEAIVPLERHTEWIGLVADRLLDAMTQAAEPGWPALTEDMLPAVAGGSVLPPQLLGRLGDDVGGIRDTLDRIAARLDRMEAARRGGAVRFTAQLDRRTLFDEVIDEGRLRRDGSGSNPFSLGGR